MYKNLFTQVKRDKNIKFFVQFSEDEKLRSFTAEKQSNKTSNHVKYLRVYVCAQLHVIAYKLYNCACKFVLMNLKRTKN